MSSRTNTESRYFERSRSDYATNSMNIAIESGIITEDDRDLMQEFFIERQSAANVSQGHINKLACSLVCWRRFLGEFRTLKITDIYTGIDVMKSANSDRGTKFSQNTIFDYVAVLKHFTLWLIDNGYNSIPEKKIERIRLPNRNVITKKATDLLLPDEIKLIVGACKKSRDRAMILLLYEGGFRIGEIATLTWGDIEFVAGGASVGVLFKTKFYRHVRVVMATEYLKVWKADYPGEPTREAFVFLNGLGGPYTHSTISRRIARIVKSAGIERHVTPHIFRHSRITHLIKEGMQESAIKMMMWGQPDTRMWKTYVHLTGQDIDAEVARMYGIVDKKDDDIDIGVTPKQCTHCSTINPPLAFTCYTCGQPLDPIGVMKLEEVSRYIVEHGDVLKKYIESFTAKQSDPMKK